MLKVLLVDDEKPCLDRLSFLLQLRFADTIRIVGQCQTIAEALLAIQTKKPGLVFLDVELTLDGNRTCFDLLGGVTEIDFSVIFVTGHEQYALRAFQVDAIDYLLKPVDVDKLVRAVGKVRARSLQDQTEHQNQLSRVVGRQDRPIKRIGLPSGNGGLTFIEVQDIVYCASREGRTWFFGIRGKERENVLAMANDTLTQYEQELSGSAFCRVHDAYLINMAYLKEYVNGRGGQVVMIDNTELPVSVKGKTAFKRCMQSGLL